MIHQTPLPGLKLHLALAWTAWQGSSSALRSARDGLQHLNPRHPALDLLGAAPLDRAVQNEARRRFESLLSGVKRYLEYSYTRNLVEPPAIWQSGSVRLLDYGQLEPLRRYHAVVLCIPSLINRYYVLDLQERRSFARYLLSQGLRPLVVDWGAPSPAEADFDCAAYIMQRLIPALHQARQIAGSLPLIAAGYCMGGLLTLAMAQAEPGFLRGLALLATPWDFHAPDVYRLRISASFRQQLAEYLRAEGLSAEAVQGLFYLVDPWIFQEKFQRFASLNGDDEASREFVALERWVNDGVELTSGVAMDCLIHWAQDNQPAQGKWQVGGPSIDPRALNIPCFAAVPRDDRIVPPGCALPLARALKRCELVQPAAGHVGMLVGSRGEDELWRPFVEWVRGVAE